MSISVSKQDEKLGKLVKKSLDGRTQRWLAGKLGIKEDKLSNKLKGIAQFTAQELEKINLELHTEFSLPTYK